MATVQTEAARQLSPAELLAALVEKTALKKEKEAELEEIKAQCYQLAEQVKSLFVEMGVKQMKAAGKTVYLAKQIWAGTGEGATNLEVAHALEKLNLSSFVSYNHQSLSSYVREFTKDFPEWFNRDGDLVVASEDIIKALPEPLNKLLSVTEKVDIKVRAK